MKVPLRGPTLAGTDWHTESREVVRGFQDVARAVNEPDFGVSAARPTDPAVGQPYFDTTLGKPVWWNGISWITW